MTVNLDQRLFPTGKTDAITAEMVEDTFPQTSDSGPEEEWLPEGIAELFMVLTLVRRKPGITRREVDADETRDVGEHYRQQLVDTLVEYGYIITLPGGKAMNVAFRRPPQIVISCPPNSSSIGAVITQEDGSAFPGEYTRAEVAIDWATGEPPVVDIHLREILPKMDIYADVMHIVLNGRKYRLVEENENPRTWFGGNVQQNVELTIVSPGKQIVDAELDRLQSEGKLVNYTEFVRISELVFATTLPKQSE